MNNQSYERPPILQFVLLFVAFIALLLIILSGESEPLPIIRADNVREVEQIARFGHGQVLDAAWSPDGNTIALAGSIGVWLYDAQLLDSTPRLLEGHTQIVRDVAFHPDSQLLASAGNDGTIRLWDVNTGKELHTLRGHHGIVLNIIFSPDGQLLASAGNDQSVRLWDTTTAVEQNVLITSGVYIYSLAFNPSGTLLAAMTDANQVYVWNVAAGQEQAVLTDERLSYQDKVLFSPDGQYLVAGSYGRVKRVWLVEANLNISDVENIDVSKLDAAVTAQLGLYPAFIGFDESTFDPQTGIKWFALQSHSSAMQENMTVSPDGRQIVTHFDYRWEKFDLANPDSPRTLRTVTNPIDSVALISNGDTALITTTYEGFVWRPFEGSSRSVSIKDTGRYIPEMIFIQSRPIIVANSWEGGTTLINAETGEYLQELEGFSGSIESWDFDTDSERLVINIRQGTTYLIDLETGQEISQITSDDAGRGYAYATFSSNGTQIAMAGYDPECDCTVSLLWDGLTTTALGPFPGSIHSFAFSPDDRLLAVGGNIPTAEGFGGRVQIWDLQTRSEKDVFTGPPYTVNYLLFNPDNRHVAGSGFDGSIWLWDIDQPDSTRLALKSESDYRDYRGMAFSPDGRLFAVGTRQGEIILFNVATGSELTRLVGHKARITDIVFSANGTLLLSGSEDGTAQLWGINPPPMAEPIQNPDNSVEMPMATMTPSPAPTRAPTLNFLSASPTPTRVP